MKYILFILSLIGIIQLFRNTKKQVKAMELLEVAFSFYLMIIIFLSLLLIFKNF